MKAAFFDMDGVLVKTFTIFEFAKYLSDKGLFEKDCIGEMEDQLSAYKKGLNYHDFAVQFMDSYIKGIKGMKEEDVKNSAAGFGSVCEKYFYPYTKSLIDLMKEDVKVVGVSGTPVEAFDVLKDMFGLDDVFGSEFEVKDGAYTGNAVYLRHTSDGKRQAVKEYVRLNDIDLSNSFAFGDSTQDLPFMELVGYPIALNPNKELAEIAKERDWKILYEKDNIINEVRIMMEELR